VTQDAFDAKRRELEISLSELTKQADSYFDPK